MIYSMYRNKGFGKKHPSSKEKKDIVKLYRSGSSIEVLSEIFGFHFYDYLSVGQGKEIK